MYHHDGGWSHFVKGLNVWINQAGIVLKFVKNIRLEAGWIDSNLTAGAPVIGCAAIKLALTFPGNSAPANNARAHIEFGQTLDKTDLTGCTFPC